MPWEAYALSGGSFITALGIIFGAPHRAAAAVNNARAEYWQSRLRADQARAEYLDWRSSRYGPRTLQGLSAPSIPESPEGVTEKPETSESGNEPDD